MPEASAAAGTAPVEVAPEPLSPEQAGQPHAGLVGPSRAGPERAVQPTAAEPAASQSQALEPAATAEDRPDLAHPIAFLSNIEVQAAVELGRATLPIGEVLRLGPGSVVHLDSMLGDPVNLMVKGRLVARGEVVVVDDKFGLRITEIVSRRAT